MKIYKQFAPPVQMPGAITDHIAGWLSGNTKEYDWYWRQTSIQYRKWAILFEPGCQTSSNRFK